MYREKQLSQLAFLEELQKKCTINDVSEAIEIGRNILSIAKRLDETADWSTIERRLDSPVRNVTESFYNDYVKANAEFRSAAGLKSHIIRETDGNCCAWCSALAGQYEYPNDVPPDVYARHDNCNCTVTYISDKTKQDVWSKKRYALSADERKKILENTPKPERFTREQGKAVEKANLNGAVGVANSGKSGIMKLKDISIGRSVGAKARNYDILDPKTGEYFNFVEGTRIQNPKVFAGKGGVKPLKPEVAEGLSEQIGGKAENWQHCKGKGFVDYYGEERMAEVHWFQEETVGKHKFKVKRWLDDDS